MKNNLPVIGFDRYVDIDWCRCALDMAIGDMTLDEVQNAIALVLSGAESQRKTIDILKRLSIKPFDSVSDFVIRGVKLYELKYVTNIFPIVWGIAIVSYPFFGKNSEITGRLLNLHGQCSIKEIQRRMAENYGDRNGIERAVNRILQTQSNWGALVRDDSNKHVSIQQQFPIDSDTLSAWLIEAAVRYVGKPISIDNLQVLPVLFPFRFTRPVSYLISISERLCLLTQGSNTQYVALKTDC